MCKNHDVYADVSRVYAAARRSPDPDRCMVAPSPELNERLRKEIAELSTRFTSRSGLRLRATEPRAEGFNDGMIIPPTDFPLGTSPSVIRNQALDRAPLHGTVRVIVVLVDFSDRPMARSASDLDQLFFSNGVIPTGSVREYFTEVTNGLVDLQGQVVGPFRLPQTLATYCHGDSGTGAALPNARTMARDALAAADPSVNFGPYDNDGNGFVDAFVVVHAGAGAEQTGSSNDIWSHKWTLPSGAVTTDGTKVFGYLTVPEDCRIGVCAHELGHLLFGFPDLYDTDGSSEGIGRFCLMASGSWGGGGDTPTHPSAWCKANQGWATVDNVTVNGMRSIADVKDSHSVLRLWKDGGSGSEYFLVENRQQTRFDATLPGGGLLIWHIDESVATNSNEARYKVALVQADNEKDLENSNNRGDAGDPYPGTTGNSSFTNTSSPNSKSYAGQNTCVSVTSISAPGAVMTANVKVKCGLKAAKEFIKDKEFVKELRPEKPIIDKQIDKQIDKRPEKPVIDKSISFDKPFDKQVDKQVDKPIDKPADKPVDGGLPGGGLPGGFGRGSGDPGMMEARMAQLEALVGTLLGQGGAQGGQGMQGAQGAQGQGGPQPFIGAGLRPDLSQGALADEEDARQDAMRRGDAAGKRSYDTKPGDV